MNMNTTKQKEFWSVSFKPIPSTRYQGSKQKIVKWIWNNIKDLKFDTFLDAFGGTGVVGYYAKLHNKEVTFNDILKSNFVIGLSLIENNKEKLSQEDVEFILKKHSGVKYPTFIQETFKDIYYTDEENKWLDIVVTNIRLLKSKYKQAIAYNALFQACIAKRPYNLFHRKNLYLRTASVKRSFGNKTTWDTPFPNHFKKFVREINNCIYDNGRNNKAINLDVFEIPDPKKYDLVYIDTPYFSAHSMTGVDYRDFYHFLEGIMHYDRWGEMIDYKSKHLRLKRVPCVWTNKKKIYNAFDRLFEKFKESNLIVSYRSGGIPTPEEMVHLLRKYKSNVEVKSKKYQYVLSPNGSSELLFIAPN